MRVFETRLKGLGAKQKQMKSITIEGQLRTEHGKKATRQLRSQENVPGVIYGGARELSGEDACNINKILYRWYRIYTMKTKFI